MDFANCIDTYDRSREGSVRTRAVWLTFAQILPGDPSRPGWPTLIRSQTIPLARVFDTELIALEDSTKKEDLTFQS
ncbi:MAG TPA: hypothetical protein VK589_17160 [Chryseolinea sp.]|nr:hypothetical protein [Chryseolinea sp.]